MIGAREAIVDDQSGVTRDRHYGSAEWLGREFSVVDTGGYVENSSDIFETEIKKQVLIALEEADVVLFMVDITTGITAEDEAFVKVLRKVNKPIIVLANKVDNHMQQYMAADFYAFGLDEVMPISSISGSGSGDVLDRVIELLGEKSKASLEPDDDLPKFCILGKPNVGKSTFVNALIGEERNIVADIPGTTRDSIYTRYNKYDKTFYLIDTAGIRRKSSVHEDIEFYSVMRAIQALEKCDVAFIMIDAEEGISSQDMNIIGLALKRKKGLVLLINKWDNVSNKSTNTVKEYTEELKGRLAPFTDLPILFISALEKKRIYQALEDGLRVSENMKKRISTSKLNQWMEVCMKKHPVPSHGGRFVKIKYLTQLPTPTPVFAFFCNMPNGVKDSYKRFLENEMRKSFDFTGVPIKFVFKKK